MSFFYNKDITLPDELYIKILQHLRNQGLLSSSTLSTFLIPKIHSINFTSCVQINDECIETISKICPSLQNLGMFFLFISSSYSLLLSDFPSFPLLPSYLPLPSLYFIYNFPIPSSSFLVVNFNLAVLSKCPMITDHGIQVIANACLGLRLLHISKCYQITDKAFADSCVSLF